MVALAATVPNPPPDVSSSIWVTQSLFAEHTAAVGAVNVNERDWVPDEEAPQEAGETALHDHPVQTNAPEQLTADDCDAPLPEVHVALQVTVTV